MECFKDTAIGHGLEVCQPLLVAVADHFCKICIDGVSRRNDELRKRIVHFLQFDAAPFRDLDSLIENLRDLAEDAVHILTGFEIELIGVELHAVRFVDGLARLNAQQNVVRPAIILMHVVAVVGCSDANTGALPDAQHVRDDLALLFQPVIVDFRKKRSLPKISWYSAAAFSA